MKFILSSISENRSCSTKCAGGDTAEWCALRQERDRGQFVAALAPWTESSVKSALYRDVAKVKGYGARTDTSDDGTQRYHLVLPKGIEAPLGHVEPTTIRMAANTK